MSISKFKENSQAINKVYGSGTVAWGFPLPETAVGGVSCRLIWTREYLGELEFLGDRSEFTRANDIEDFQQLDEEFCGVIRAEFKAWASENNYQWDSEDYVIFEYKNFKALLNCNSSYGYVYASFWEDKNGV